MISSPNLWKSVRNAIWKQVSFAKAQCVNFRKEYSTAMETEFHLFWVCYMSIRGFALHSFYLQPSACFLPLGPSTPRPIIFYGMGFFFPGFPGAGSGAIGIRSSTKALKVRSSSRSVTRSGSLKRSCGNETPFFSIIPIFLISDKQTIIT